MDISYLNLGGSFYFLISVLDGFSRYIVHREIRESMTEQDVESVLARAMEKHPGVQPRIISDNGLRFIAKDFNEFIRTYNLTHLRTSHPKQWRARTLEWLDQRGVRSFDL